MAHGPGHRRGLERQPAHGAVDAVRPDHEIVFAARSVAELDRDDAVALSEALDGQPDSDGHVTRRLAEKRVQLGPMQREARPDGCPQLGDVDLAQQPAVVVVEALARDLDGSGGDLRLQAEGTERASGVAGQIDAGTGRPPRGSRSITSTATPMRASMGASASPAIPPPTISTRRRSMSAQASGRHARTGPAD